MCVDLIAAEKHPPKASAASVRRTGVTSRTGVRAEGARMTGDALRGLAPEPVPVF